MCSRERGEESKEGWCRRGKDRKDFTQGAVVALASTCTVVQLEGRGKLKEAKGGYKRCARNPSVCRQQGMRSRAVEQVEMGKLGPEKHKSG